MTRDEYLKSRTRKGLIQIINAFCIDADALGTDASLRFVDYSDDPDVDRGIGFMCTHTGEMVEAPKRKRQPTNPQG